MPGVFPPLPFLALTLQVLESATNRHEDLTSARLKSGADIDLFNFILVFVWDLEELDQDWFGAMENAAVRAEMPSPPEQKGQ